MTNDEDDPVIRYADVVIRMEGANEIAGEPEDPRDEVYRLTTEKGEESEPSYVRFEKGAMVPCTEEDFVRRMAGHLADVVRRNPDMKKLKIGGISQKYALLIRDELNARLRGERS